MVKNNSEGSTSGVVKRVAVAIFQVPKRFFFFWPEGASFKTTGHS